MAENPGMTVGAFGLSAILSYVITFLCIAVSHRLNLLDYPADIKIHQRPMPFLGGLGVFAAFWSVAFAGTEASFNVFLGSLVIFLVGFFDDKFHWSPVKKLLGQSAATLLLMSSGLTINLLSGLGFFGHLATFLWVLLIVNAFNFIDSLDGHCAGIALISSIMLFWFTQVTNQPVPGLLIAIFAGALLGFFPHNFKPAKIFLGDNGSLFIGYMMAVFTLLCRYRAPETSFATFFIPLLIFGVPIYDTLSVIGVRLSRGIAPWRGDRNHFAHRLVKTGMSEKVAVLFSYFIAFAMGHIAILTTQVNWFGAVLIGIIFFSIMGLIAILEYHAAQRAKIQSKRPWGGYEVLYRNAAVQVKRIEVKPHHRCSLQKHLKRAEKWIVTSGDGMVTLGQKQVQIRKGSFVDIPQGEIHRAHNTGKKPLVFIEVQFGNYLGEDDIVRLEDDYGRA